MPPHVLVQRILKTELMWKDYRAFFNLKCLVLNIIKNEIELKHGKITYCFTDLTPRTLLFVVKHLFDLKYSTAVDLKTSSILGS